MTQLQAQNLTTAVESEKLVQLQAQYDSLQATQSAYHRAMQQLSRSYASFCSRFCGFQSATSVITSLEQQLQVLSTAHRLFGRPFPDLFEFIVDHMDDLPRSRQRQKSQKSQVQSLHTVPA